MFSCLLCSSQIWVHQECYGAKHVQDFTFRICRVCETPDVERECCLCPVKDISYYTLLYTYLVSAVILCGEQLIISKADIFLDSLFAVIQNAAEARS